MFKDSIIVLCSLTSLRDNSCPLCQVLVKNDNVGIPPVGIRNIKCGQPQGFAPTEKTVRFVSFLLTEKSTYTLNLK